MSRETKTAEGLTEEEKLTLKEALSVLIPLILASIYLLMPEQVSSNLKVDYDSAAIALAISTVSLFVIERVLVFISGREESDPQFHDKLVSVLISSSTISVFSLINIDTIFDRVVDGKIDLLRFMIGLLVYNTYLINGLPKHLISGIKKIGHKAIKELNEINSQLRSFSWIDLYLSKIYKR